MEITQNLLNDYKAGVTITQINLGDVQPPREVANAFAEVVRDGGRKPRGRRDDRRRHDGGVPRADGDRAAGGDVGSGITRSLANQFPEATCFSIWLSSDRSATSCFSRSGSRAHTSESPTKVEIRFENGVLTLTLPKAPGGESRKLPIH